MSDILYVVMPAYNEEENIEKSVRDWLAVLEGKDERSRIVVADSGSEDGTHNILVKMQKEIPQLMILGDTLKQHGPKLIALYNFAIEQGADSMERNPNIDAEKIESLITPKTKVLVPVHYAGVACDMDKIMEIAERHNLLVVEDAAQAIDSCYKGRPLGSIGHMAAFSFHETKNIISGEGGMLVINDERFIRRAEILWMFLL